MEVMDQGGNSCIRSRALTLELVNTAPFGEKTIQGQIYNHWLASSRQSGTVLQENNGEEHRNQGSDIFSFMGS